MQDGEKDLSALCQLWLESKDHITSKVQLVCVVCVLESGVYSTAKAQSRPGVESLPHQKCDKMRNMTARLRFA